MGSSAPTLDERLLFFAEAASYTPLLAVERADATFIVQTVDQVVGRLLFTKGRRREFDVLDRALAALAEVHMTASVAGSTFVDVGANIGTSVIEALRSHGFTRGVACEPEPTNYRLLKANLALNDLADRVRALPVAVSDAVGEIALFISRRNSGGHSLEPGRAELPDDREQITVDRVTLDLLVERGLIDPAQVGLLWMDVQGHEGHVLRGAASLRTRGVPIVLEVSPSDGEVETLASVVSDAYTHFVDLRSPRSEHELHDVARLADFAAPFEESHTDILVMRLKGSQQRRWTRHDHPRLAPRRWKTGTTVIAMIRRSCRTERFST